MYDFLYIRYGQFETGEHFSKTIEQCNIWGLGWRYNANNKMMLHFNTAKLDYAPHSCIYEVGFGYNF